MNHGDTQGAEDQAERPRFVDLCRLFSMNSSSTAAVKAAQKYAVDHGEALRIAWTRNDRREYWFGDKSAVRCFEHSMKGPHNKKIFEGVSVERHESGSVNILG